MKFVVITEYSGNSIKVFQYADTSGKIARVSMREKRYQREEAALDAWS